MSTPDITWKELQAGAIDAVKSTFPVEGRTRSLVLNNVTVDDSAAVIGDLRGQERAKETGRTWGANVVADISLLDKTTNKIIDRSKTKIFTLPRPTDRYSYIVDGSEWQVDNLWRLKPGVYSQIKANGDLETEFALAGASFAKESRLKIPFSPENKKFKFRWGTTNINLYPILKTLGVQDEDMKKAWGPDIYKANATAKIEQDIQKLYKGISKRGVRAENSSYDAIASAVFKEFHNAELAPDTTKHTLGKPISHVTGEALLLASKRILDVAQGITPPDDRNSLIFKKLTGVDDFLRERLSKSSTQRIIKLKVGNNIDRADKVRDILSSELFSKPIKQIFTSSSLSKNPEQTNPLEMISNYRSTTILGGDEGGIKSDRTLNKQMKLINPTHMGFLDPIHTPECSPQGTEIYTKLGWKKFEDITEDDELLCRPEGISNFSVGDTRFCKPERVIKSFYKGLLFGMDNGKIAYSVTPNHRVICRPLDEGSHWRITTADLVHDRPRVFPVAHTPVIYNNSPKFFELPLVTDYEKNIDKIDMEDWAEFMGWFLSEGSTCVSNYSVVISQSKEVNPNEYSAIQLLLNRLPFGVWGTPSRGTSFTKSHKQLSSYLKKFGDCYSKFIPDYIFTASVTARERFMEAMLLGDGRLNSNRKPESKTKSYKQKVYTTTSPRLADGFEKLAIEMGYSVSRSVYEDNREERYFDVHEIRLLRHRERAAHPISRIRRDRKKIEFVSQYSTVEYEGMVYCATVPGGLLFIRMPGRLGMWTGNSVRTGISLTLPLGVTKDGNEARATVYDLKEHKLLEGKNGLTPAELHSEFVLLPDQVKVGKDGRPIQPSGHVKMKDPTTGEIVLRSMKDARYMFVSPHQLFDEATNLIPFLQNNQGNRTMTASRQASQAVGLRDRETPLVQVQGGNTTWEHLIGIPFSQTAPTAGKIVDIRSDQSDNRFPDSIILQDKSGTKHEIQIYNHFPLNDTKTFMHSIPKVQVGQEVKEGDLLADTNFTRDGKLALGTNLRVSYMPYKGYNFEDGIVISNSAAQKLTSEHVHRKSIEIDPTKDSMNKKKFQAFSSVTAKKYGKTQLDRLDDDGVIRVGQKINPGDLLIAAVGKKENLGMVSRLAARLDKSLFDRTDRSVSWDGSGMGEIVKVQKLPNGKGAVVHVRTDEPAEVGDKIVGRHGNKSIIVSVVPDHEMPRIGAHDGQHVEVLMNPSGVPSRINLGQMLETAASKIAIKTGKPYIVNNFDSVNTNDYTEKVKQDLKDHGLTDTEEIYDPTTHKKLGDVLTGDQYIMKLKHQVEKKLAVRSVANYTIDRSPKGTGSANPGQGIGQLEFYALLAHGARKNLKEMATYKADQQVDERLNPQAHIDFWHRVQMGQPLPAPRPTFAYRKFESYLNGLGINIRKEGHEMQLIPLTDKGVLAMSNGEIPDPGRVLRGKDAKELEKGLFDPKITGGLPDAHEPGKGLNWAHITLAKPMPSPVFVGTAQKPGPAVILTGLKFNEFEDIVKGKKVLNGKTGGEAIKDILDGINVKKELNKVISELPALKGSALNHANRKAKYLNALDTLNMKPSDAYMMNHVPVIPPVFRPIVPMPDGSLRYDDINHLYKDLGTVNNKLKEGIKDLPEVEQPLREELYDLLKSTMGVGGIPQYESSRKLKGILDTIAGTSPKQGFFQKKIMKRRQELSMRSTIIPEPAMHLDYVGIPRSAAMELYKPFVIRELKTVGRSPLEARKDLKEETPAAWRALEKALDSRPVILKRDPALHKFSIMAFKPKLVDGKAIRIHPLVTSGFNADFDGNCFIGTSKVVLKFCDKHGTATDISSVEKEFAMKFVAGTTIQLGYNSGVIIDTEIQQIPYLIDTRKIDKNGAAVYDVPEGIFVLSYDHQNKVPKFCQVTAVTVEGSCEVAKVTTRLGLDVTSSINESLCVYDHYTQEIKDVCPKDAIGKLSPIIRKVPTSNLYGDFEFGWMLGAFVSDGIKNGDTVGIVKILDSYRDRFYKAVSAYENKLPKRTTFRSEHSVEKGDDITGPSVKDHIYNVEKTASLFEHCFVCPRVEGRASLSKKLPEISTLTQETLVGILLGLLEGDGSLSISHGKRRAQVMASFGTSSNSLVTSILALCKFLGIRAGVTPYDPKNGRLQKHRAYIINFSTPDLEKYAPILLDKCCDPAIVAPLKLLINEGTSKDDRDIVPVPEQIMTICASTQGPITDTSMQRSLATIKSSRKNGWYISRDMAKRVLKYLSEAHVTDLHNWTSLVNSEDIHWDVITEISNIGQATVYDLVVPETKVFAVNDGLVVWDTMSAFLPLTDDAVREAQKMFPSNNLFSSTNGGIMYAPSQEALLGLHLLSKWGEETNKKFPNFDQLKKEYDKGTIKMTDVVLVNGKPTTYGRRVLANQLPKEFQSDEILYSPGAIVTKKGGGGRIGILDLLSDIGKKDPKKFANTVDRLKDLGNKHAYDVGFSLSLDDLKVHKDVRDAILSKADDEATAIRKSSLSAQDKEDKLVALYDGASHTLDKAIRPLIEKSHNNIYTMVDSGARGNWSQFRQMNIAPMIMQDATGRKLPTPVKRSYAEGLDVGDYWTALHGARMGTLQRAEGTSEPGMLTKDIINFVIPEMIVSKECGTKEGISMDIHDEDIHDRLLAKPLAVGGQKFDRNTIVTPALTALLKKNHVNQIVVRSPLKCQHGLGICSKCFGLNENGVEHEIGTNIGVIAGHSLGEPAMQLAMDCNAAGNLITVNLGGLSYILTFEQLWNRIQSTVDVDGDIETKIPENLEVWDHNKMVPVHSIQRHKPHGDMFFARTESGHCFISQDSHPNWVREDIVRCPKCGSEEPVKFVSHHKSGEKTTVRCIKCETSHSVSRRAYQGQQETVVRTDHLEGMYMGICSEQRVEDINVDMPLPPYLLGIFLAEGNVRRERVLAEIEEGTKQRQKVGSGLLWKVLSVEIAQDPGLIQDKIKEHLVQSNIEFTTPSVHNIRLNDVVLARKLWAQCGIHSNNKQLPPGWLKQPIQWKLEFLAGLLDGDGTLVSKHTAALDTTSWSLVSQVQQLVRSLGGWSTVYLCTVKDLTRHQGFRVTIDLAHSLPSIKNFPLVETNSEIRENYYSKVVQVKKVEFYTDWTYDLSTSTRGFSSNYLKTHNSFHTGGVSGSRGAGATTRIGRLKELLKLPAKLPDSATLARTSGRVDKIEKDPTGWNIYINGQAHFSPATRKLMYDDKPLEVGMSVKKGTPITEGPINPRELLPLTDVPTVQNHLVSELYDGIYKDERVRRRNIETVVRSLTNLAQIRDPGDSSGFMTGDVVSRSLVEEHNRTLAAGHKPIEYRPVLKGMEQGVLDTQEDWLARLNFRRLKETIMEGAAKGWKTNLHGTHPVPAYAVGSEFGEGTKHEPWKY